MRGGDGWRGSRIKRRFFFFKMVEMTAHVYVDRNNTVERETRAPRRSETSHKCTENRGINKLSGAEQWLSGVGRLNGTSYNQPVTLEETFLNDDASKGMAGGSTAAGHGGRLRTPSEPVCGHGAESTWPMLQDAQRTSDVAVRMFLDPSESAAIF